MVVESGEDRDDGRAGSSPPPSTEEKGPGQAGLTGSREWRRALVFRDWTPFETASAVRCEAAAAGGERAPWYDDDGRYDGVSRTVSVELPASPGASDV